LKLPKISSEKLIRFFNLALQEFTSLVVVPVSDEPVPDLL